MGSLGSSHTKTPQTTVSTGRTHTIHCTFCSCYTLYTYTDSFDKQMTYDADIMNTVTDPQWILLASTHYHAVTVLATFIAMPS